MWNFQELARLSKYFKLRAAVLPPQFPVNKMRPIGNKLYRESATRLEEAVALDQEILRLEDSIRKLKIDFDIFFNGATKRPPLEARARLESNLKRISDDRALTYAQRYRLSSIIARYTSYRELWRRNLKARGDDLI
jgi:hypothetical protein